MGAGGVVVWVFCGSRVAPDGVQAAQLLLSLQCQLREQRLVLALQLTCTAEVFRWNRVYR